MNALLRRFALSVFLLPTAAACHGSGATTPEATDFDAGECTPPPSGLPTDVYCTGLYAARSPSSLAPGVMPYTPGVTLWSDGAEKHRFLYLPPGTKIDTTDQDAWKFPVGTKVWKEFRFSGALVETRVLWKRDAATWEVGTYVWDAAGTSATLNTNPKPTILASGYEIPMRKDCDKCHHGASDQVLGVEAVALGLPRAQGVTMSYLVQNGLLTNPPDSTTIALPEDSTGKAGEALGYLHANCGMPCHSGRGIGNTTQLLLRLHAGEFWPTDGGVYPVALPDAGGDASTAGTYPLSATQTEAYRDTLRQVPTTGAIAQHFPGEARVSPGDHAHSLVWTLSNRRDPYQMPPIVSHVVDMASMQAIADWIDAIPTTGP